MASLQKYRLLLILFFGFALALFIRLLLIPNPGFEADISFWKSWGLAVVDFGMVKGLAMTNFNYPTPFGYFLFWMVKVYSFVADPHNFNEFWTNTNLPFLFVSKLPAIAADFGIAGLILWIGKHSKKIGFPELPFSFYCLLSIVYLLNPIAIIDGAWWGQVDSVGLVIFLAAFILTLTKKPFLAGAVFMLAMMTKLQNMIYGPIFFLFTWELLGFEGIVKSLSGAALAFFGLNIEFVLSHQMDRVVQSITGNYDYFPWLSLNAFNPWWVVSGAQGMQHSDKFLAISLANAKTVGLYIFSSVYLFAILRMMSNWVTWVGGIPTARRYGLDQQTNINSETTTRSTTLKKQHAGIFEHWREGQPMAGPIQIFLESLILVNGAFFLFQTESHDRYAFPLIVFLLLWAPFWIVRELRITNYELRIKQFMILYSLFSIFYFYNLHTALVFNYPHNGLPILSLLIQPAFTLTASYLLTGFFLWFLLFLKRETHLLTYLIPIGFFAIAITAKNLPLMTRKPVYLTSITPFTYRQDYGQRMINMPTNASFGFDKWSALSVQYAFYRHGIGTHAGSVQEYDIGGHFKTFSFDYGIDTQGGPRGSVTFEVYGDGKKLFTSGKVVRYELPHHASVDIRGVKVLKLVVTNAGDGNTDDHADWLNAQLFP